MKSQALPEIPLIGLIATVTIVAGILIPPSIITSTINKELFLTYEYEKTQYSLLTLLSSNHEGKPIYEIIANNVNNPKNLEFLKTYLDQLIESKCYSVKVGIEDAFTTVIENGFCRKDKLSFTTIISLPYNPDLNSRTKLLRIDVG